MPSKAQVCIKVFWRLELQRENFSGSNPNLDEFVPLCSVVPETTTGRGLDGNLGPDGGRPTMSDISSLK